MLALFLLIIHEVLSFGIIDDLPVLDHRGCDDCLRVYVPVCGTDKKTYTNICRLNCLNSKRNQSEWVFIERYGPCNEVSVILSAHKID
ncbi:serine protease inhibitor Kazal-type 1-like [Pieris brassicae]|uniref:serine protease inhibitor Kazal-type 1-like n=1 Tax=Pieris brassicae TaxID=7116 RepID=UPI001E65EBB2|nr:serine protease inhibitor Kazal-type 1-like [Pieris brassicae]